MGGGETPTPTIPINTPWVYSQLDTSYNGNTIPGTADISDNADTDRQSVIHLDIDGEYDTTLFSVVAKNSETETPFTDFTQEVSIQDGKTRIDIKNFVYEADTMLSINYYYGEQLIFNGACLLVT